MSELIYGVKGVYDLIPPKEQGIAKISRFEFNEKDDFLFNLRASRDHPMFRMRSGKYLRLSVGNQLMMSDTAMERISNKKFIDYADGRVLIAGLGIGLIIHNILHKESITEIIIIEKHQDVIDLVAPYFTDPRLKIICADIFEWKPQKGEKFDTIYFDIWPQITTENLKQIKVLHNKFKFYKSEGAYMDSWLKWYLQKLKRNKH
jgi:spermidine synthase